MSEAEPDNNRISFISEHGPPLQDEAKHRAWLEKVIQDEGKLPGRIVITFVSDETLHALNVKHLQHDTLTDILTFPYIYEPIETDIFISADRVAENAQTHDTTYTQELRRVMVHGILHMCGHGDASEDEKQKMRAREDTYLNLWKPEE